jgi:hypothetical protein
VELAIGLENPVMPIDRRTQPDTAAYGIMYALNPQAWDQGARPAASGPLPCCGARLGHFGCGLDHSPGEPLSSFVDEGRDIAQLVGTNASH